MPLSLRRLRCVALALLLCAASLLPVRAQDANARHAPARRHALDQILSSLNRGRTIGQVAVSPDGKRLAWLESGQIRVAPLDNLAHSQRVTAASPGQSCVESDFAWSPDSAALAFLSDCADPGGQTDLYLSHLDGNPARRLTDLHGDVDAPAFSPDGKASPSSMSKAPPVPPALSPPRTAPSGVIGEDRHRDPARRHRSPPTPPARRPSLLTPANLHVFEFDWSPDSKSLAYIAADPPGENNWWVAKLYTQSVAARIRLRVPQVARFGTWDSRTRIPPRSSLPPTSPARSTACRSPFPAGRPTANPSPSSAAS